MKAPLITVGSRNCLRFIDNPRYTEEKWFSLISCKAAGLDDDDEVGYAARPRTNRAETIYTPLELRARIAIICIPAHLTSLVKNFAVNSPSVIRKLDVSLTPAFSHDKRPHHFRASLCPSDPSAVAAATAAANLITLRRAALAPAYDILIRVGVIARPAVRLYPRAPIR